MQHFDMCKYVCAIVSNAVPHAIASFVSLSPFKFSNFCFLLFTRFFYIKALCDNLQRLLINGYNNADSEVDLQRHVFNLIICILIPNPSCICCCILYVFGARKIHSPLSIIESLKKLNANQFRCQKPKTWIPHMFAINIVVLSFIMCKCFVLQKELAPFLVWVRILRGPYISKSAKSGRCKISKCKFRIVSQLQRSISIQNRSTALQVKRFEFLAPKNEYR